MIGTRINNYEVLSLIGEGGMGNVYLARHPLIGRGAAIKVLHLELATDRNLVERFFNEARAANAIRHPNIIDIIDVGLLPGTERPYLMMELLEGENLAARLARMGSLPVPQALDVARQTASALAAAHGKGIIHRDLKPENLFLVPHGSLPGREVVKVLDFGIAKLRSQMGDASKVQTQTGMLMGTPPYMSPEQCRGLTGEIDLRTDVYALGIILFEMLCGGPPFIAAGFGDLLVMHITQPPPPPRSRNPAVPEALEAIILKALAKSPGERFGNMVEFENALAGVKTGDGTRPTLDGLGPVGSDRARSSKQPVTRPSTVPPQAASESGVVRRATPAPRAETSTTFRASAGEVSQDMEELAIVRSRRPMILGGLAVVGVGLVVAMGLSGRSKTSESPPPPIQPVTSPPQETAAMVPPRSTTPSMPAAGASVRPDAGVAPPGATARPARRSPTSKPAGEKKRPPPEKW